MRRRGTGWPWFGLAWQSAELAIEAQQVIALRVAKITAGGRQAEREAALMLTEKLSALAVTQHLMLNACLQGKPEKGAKRVVGYYGRRVGANKRRLRKD